MTKVHLRAGRGRVACGLPHPAQLTDQPGEVTCLLCRKSVLMADTEFRLINPQQPRRRRNRKGSK